jgi:ribosomal protein S18 acetylase RimI-like enzyme
MLLTPTAMRPACSYLGMLAVDSRHGSSGVGRALMAEGERTAAAVYGAPGVVLFVLSARKDILTWYTRRGYVDTGLRHEVRCVHTLRAHAHLQGLRALCG